MTPTGTTYITLGSHGFYYREFLSTSIKRPRSSPPHAEASTGTPADNLGTADPRAFTDSSNQALIEQLNHKARLGNPAWFLYVFAVAVLAASMYLLGGQWARHRPGGGPPPECHPASKRGAHGERHR